MQNLSFKEKVNTSIESPIKTLNYKINGPIRSFSPHWHEETEIIIIIEGEMLVEIGNESKTVKAGDIIIANPNEIHTGFSGENGARYYVMQTNFNLISNGGYTSKKYIEPITKHQVGFKHFITNPEIFNSFKFVYETIDSNKSENTLLKYGLINYMVALLYENDCIVKRKPYNINNSIKEVADYIDNNYTQNISVKNISDKFGYSEAYFCRFFKKHLGITPSKYINNLRLLKAENLLLNSDKSVAQIASDCGFADIFYFSAVFKKQYGISPTKFKENRNIYLVEKIN